MAPSSGKTSLQFLDPLYEQLGAPTCLYRNRPAWHNSFTQHLDHRSHNDTDAFAAGPPSGPIPPDPWVRHRYDKPKEKLRRFSHHPHLQEERRAAKLLNIASFCPELERIREMTRNSKHVTTWSVLSRLSSSSPLPESHDLYGNCLQTMRFLGHGASTSSLDDPLWYIVRPWSAKRNVITASRILFPNDKSRYRLRLRHAPSAYVAESVDTLEEEKQGQEAEWKDTENDRRRRRVLSTVLRRNSVDMGGPVRQIVRCGNDHGSDDQSYCGDVRWFMARTSTGCSVLRFAQDDGPTQTEYIGRDGEDAMIFSSSLEEIGRVSFDENEDGDSNAPRWCAAYRDDGGFFGSPTFAILGSRGDHIRHVTVGGDGLLPHLTHAFSASTSRLRMIEFSSHPMILWGNGSSAVQSADNGIDGGCSRSPFGNVLFRLDMRSNAAHRVWSPSHAEYHVEGFCTVRSMLQHPSKAHTLYATNSLRTLFELDTRMPMKVVNKWSLPGMTERVRHGGDILNLVNVASLRYERKGRESETIFASAQQPSPAILSIGKAPQSYGLHLYQPPYCRPRFQTLPLECGPCLNAEVDNCSGMDDVSSPNRSLCSSILPSNPGSGLARSATFALPDFHHRVFYCGLTSIRLPLSRLVHEINNKDRGRDAVHGERHDGKGSNSPVAVVCALTLTSVGDLYCHTLVEGERTEPRQSHFFRGLPLGTAAIPIVSDEGKKGNEEEGNEEEEVCEAFVNIRVSNKYPVPSSAVSNYVGTKDDVRNFDTVNLPRRSCCEPLQRDKETSKRRKGMSSTFFMRNQSEKSTAAHRCEGVNDVGEGEFQSSEEEHITKRTVSTKQADREEGEGRLEEAAVAALAEQPRSFWEVRSAAAEAKAEDIKDDVLEPVAVGELVEALSQRRGEHAGYATVATRAHSLGASTPQANTKDMDELVDVHHVVADPLLCRLKTNNLPRDGASTTLRLPAEHTMVAYVGVKAVRGSGNSKDDKHGCPPLDHTKCTKPKSDITAAKICKMRCLWDDNSNKNIDKEGFGVVNSVV